MNENPGGIPNPLNPNPAPVGTEPTPVATPAEPAPQPTPVAAQPATAKPATPVTEPEPSGSVVEPKNKSKKGLAIAIILLLLVVIGGAVAAILILKPFGGGDAVPTAIQKLFNGDRPTKISMDGTISVNSEDASFPFSTLKLDFSSGINTVSAENYANIKVTATLPADNEFSFDANEVHASDGDLYLKLSGVSEALDNLFNQNLTTVNNNVLDCSTDEYSDSADCIDYSDLDLDLDVDLDYGHTNNTGFSDLSGFTGVFDVIDGDWIHISNSDFSNITGTIPTIDNSTQCLIDAADNLGNYGDDFTKLYKDNPFINYSTNNLKVAQKKNQLYQLSFDADKLANFLNAMSTSGFVNDMIACAGGVATTEKISAEEVAEILKDFPALYVEIDKDYNFTRVYLDMDANDGLANITVDLSFDYPTNITIEEPTEYVDINEVLTRVFSSFYGPSFDTSTVFDIDDSLFTF
ncbi:hypothetical protein IJJ36_00595 [Candidatus Saccharibacteria bacterium]|nr:hypothetical protein [Candidatus Saccharibacteria bacterium]